MQVICLNGPIGRLSAVINRSDSATNPNNKRINPAGIDWHKNPPKNSSLDCRVAAGTGSKYGGRDLISRREAAR